MNYSPPGPPAEGELDAAIVAGWAVNDLTRLDVLVPISHFLNRDNLAVRTWTYMWINDPGPQQATAAAGTISATATARLTSTSWAMGEPTGDATVDCAGPGRDPGGAWVGAASLTPTADTCHYAYDLMSTDERTDGDGSWTVTVSATWEITWAASTGETGGPFEVTISSSTPVRIGEWESVLVCC